MADDDTPEEGETKAKKSKRAKGPQESEPVFDPVDVDAYPPRSFADASEGVLSADHHTEEGRYQTLQMEQDPESGELRRAEDGPEGPIQNNDYVEEVIFGPDGSQVTYLAPDYS